MDNYDNFPKEWKEERFRRMDSALTEIDEITDEMKDDFVNYINNAETDAVILGCTELPILYAELGDKKAEITKKIYDPLDAALLKIKNGTV